MIRIQRASAVAAIAAVLVSGSNVRAEDALTLRPPATLHEAVRVAAQDGPVLKRVDVTLEERVISAANMARLQQAHRGRKQQIARNVLGGVIGAIGGFVVGGKIGSKLEPNCRCDDPGLQGFFIGAPIGAVAGAMIGVYAARR